MRPRVVVRGLPVPPMGSVGGPGIVTVFSLSAIAAARARTLCTFAKGWREHPSSCVRKRPVGVCTRVFVFCKVVDTSGLKLTVACDAFADHGRLLLPPASACESPVFVCFYNVASGGLLGRG